MLLTLERIKELEGAIPPVFYYQIDGGSENIAKAVIAACEAIVCMNIVNKVVLTRLIVGHTHEDIDSKFGVVWTYIRNKTLLTPQAYEKALKRCLKKKILNIILKSLIYTPFQTIKYFSMKPLMKISLDTVRKNRLSYNLFSIKCLLIKISH
jgi:hypothetical protein